MASTGNINSQNQSQKYNFDPSNISQENSALRATVAETLVDLQSSRDQLQQKNNLILTYEQERRSFEKKLDSQAETSIRIVSLLQSTIGRQREDLNKKSAELAKERSEHALVVTNHQLEVDKLQGYIKSQETARQGVEERYSKISSDLENSFRADLKALKSRNDEEREKLHDRLQASQTKIESHKQEVRQLKQDLERKQLEIKSELAQKLVQKETANQEEIKRILAEAEEDKVRLLAHQKNHNDVLYQHIAGYEQQSAIWKRDTSENKRLLKQAKDNYQKSLDKKNKLINRYKESEETWKKKIENKSQSISLLRILKEQADSNIKEANDKIKELTTTIEQKDLMIALLQAKLKHQKNDNTVKITTNAAKSSQVPAPSMAQTWRGQQQQQQQHWLQQSKQQWQQQNNLPGLCQRCVYLPTEL